MLNQQQLKIQMITLGFLPFIMVLGNSLFIPALPNIHQALGISEFQVSLLITAYSLTAACFIPLIGSLSDLMGRKRLILLCLGLIVSGGLLTNLVGPVQAHYAYPLLFIGRIIQGVGAAGTAPLAMAALTDLVEGAQRQFALSYIEIMNAFGKVLSPFLGALLATLSWATPFYFYTIVSLILLLILRFSLREEHAKSERPNTKALVIKLNDLKNILRVQGSTLLPPFIVGAILLFQLFGLLFFTADLLEHTYGVTGFWKGIALALPLVLMIISSTLWSKENTKDSEQLNLSISKLILLSLCASLPLILYQALWIVMLYLACLGWVAGRVLPQLNLLIISVTRKDQRGSVTSIYHSIRFIGVAFGPPLYGYFMNQNIHALFTIAALIIYVGYLSFTFSFRQQKSPSSLGGG